MATRLKKPMVVTRIYNWYIFKFLKPLSMKLHLSSSTFKKNVYESLIRRIKTYFVNKTFYFIPNCTL